MHLAIAPVLLGAGEHLLADIDARVVGYVCSEHVPTNTVPHVVIKKR